MYLDRTKGCVPLITQFARGARPLSSRGRRCPARVRSPRRDGGGQRAESARRGTEVASGPNQLAEGRRSPARTEVSFPAKDGGSLADAEPREDVLQQIIRRATACDLLQRACSLLQISKHEFFRHCWRRR